MSINYIYKDSGRQLMILDYGATVSLAGISWMEQYLQEFGLTIDQMASTPCNLLFVFRPSRRFISSTQIDLSILVTRKDGKEDVLHVPTYLVDAEIPFLCGKKTLEDWNFQINGRDKILDVSSLTDDTRLQLEMIDTQGGHYGIVLETQKKRDVLYLVKMHLDMKWVSFSLRIRKKNFVPSRP